MRALFARSSLLPRQCTFQYFSSELIKRIAISLQRFHDDFCVYSQNSALEISYNILRYYAPLECRIIITWSRTNMTRDNFSSNYFQCL